MKKCFLGLLLCSILAFTAEGQQIDYKKIILPRGAEATLEERLVQLAWDNHPSATIAKHESIVAENKIQHAKVKWTNLVSINGNLNEFTIKGLTGNEEVENLFYPRYNVRVAVPLSIFFENPIETRIARTNMSIQQEQINMLKLEVRKTVLKLYSEYKRTEAILNIRREAMADEESNYLLIEQRFKDGNASVDEYISAQKSRQNQRINNVNAKADFEQAKLALEEIIGVNIEEVI